MAAVIASEASLEFPVILCLEVVVDIVSDYLSCRGFEKDYMVRKIVGRDGDGPGLYAQYFVSQGFAEKIV